MKKIIPTLAQFRKDVSAIFIDEDLNYDYSLERLNYHLDPSYPSNHAPLTYDDVLKTYRSHIDLWNLRNAEKERKGYIDKVQLSKRKNFLEFLEGRMYNIDWSNTSATPLRDNYLFGSHVKQSELLIQLKDFKKLWLKNQQQED